MIATTDGLRISDSNYRSNLKAKIKRDFPEELIFFSMGTKTPETVVDARASTSEMVFTDIDGCIKNVKSIYFFSNSRKKFSKFGKA